MDNPPGNRPEHAFESISFDEIKDRLTKQLRAERTEDAELPIIDSLIFGGAAGSPNPPEFLWVQTKQIVGRPFISEKEGGWRAEYENRKGRINEVGSALRDIGRHPENIERIFHPDTPNERIRLTAFDGPAGSIYIVDDGTHRVAGAKAARLEEIPCDVRKLAYPRELITGDRNVVYEWQRRIDCGIMNGEINESPDGRSVLTITAEVVPWAAVTSQSDFLKISAVYEKVFPNGLDGLRVPREALIDPVANNFFEAGRWNEWKAAAKHHA
jgi:hypothetical protein